LDRIVAQGPHEHLNKNWKISNGESRTLFLKSFGERGPGKTYKTGKSQTARVEPYFRRALGKVGPRNILAGKDGKGRKERGQNCCTRPSRALEQKLENLKRRE